MTINRTLRALVTVVLEEADGNPEFARRLEKALGVAESIQAPKRSRSRAAAAVDPIAVLDEHGEPDLRRRLDGLSREQLLDVVAEFGMDPAKLVMKWKKLDRLVDHIVDFAKRRSVKGDAFRSRPAGDGS